MEFVDSRTIKMDKELNELDKFVIEFLRITEKHAKYVVVSGYVPILFGRSRATEDVDIFIEELTKEKFLALFLDLKKDGWLCMNADNEEEVFSYLDDNTAIRFHKRASAIPNYKKIILGSDKDIEDARHLEETFKDMIDKNKLSRLEESVRSGKHEF